MRTLLFWILSCFFTIVVIEPVSAQFWKKKKYHTESSSSKVTQPDATDYRDAFSRKSKKGPNIKTTKKPFFLFRSKKKMHKFSTSRKTRKKAGKNFFKPKHSSLKLKKKSGDTFKRNARKSKRDARKGGGGGGGIFKGRKK